MYKGYRDLNPDPEKKEAMEAFDKLNKVALLVADPCPISPPLH